MKSDDAGRPDPPASVPAARPVGGKGLGALPLLLTSPSEAFRRLGADPQWVGTFVLVALLTALAAWIHLPPTVEFTREKMVEEMESRGESEQAIAETVDRFVNPKFFFVTEILFAVLFAFVAAAILHVVINLAGPRSTFRHSSAIYWTAGLAGVLGALVKSVLMRTSETVEVSLSPAALFPDLEFGSIPALFLEIFDLFSLLTLWLLVLGVQFVLKTPRGTAWMIAGSFWALLSFARFAIAAVPTLIGKGV